MQRAALVAGAVMVPVIGLAQDASLGLVTSLTGTAQIVRASGTSAPLAFKDSLLPGDRVVTGDGSMARMLLGTRAVVTMSQRSSLTLGGERDGQVLTLSAGSIHYVVGRERERPGAVHEVRAPNAVVRVTGTVVHVEVENVSIPQTRICVLRGTVSVAGRSVELEVGANQCVLATGDRITPMPSRPRRPPPREAPPRDDLSIGLR